MKLRFSSLKVALDLLLVGIVVASILLVKSFVTPAHVGFFCDDTSIRYPFRNGSISSKVLYTVAFGLPIITILLAELYRVYKEIKRSKTEIRSLGIGDDTADRLLRRLYIILGHFVLEGCLTILFYQFLKFYLGELRPHFLDVCKPDWSKISCLDHRNESRYVLEDVCTTDDLQNLREASLSFPSGHATAAFYSSIFLVLYVETRVDSRWLFLESVKPVFQFVCLTLGSLTALSRISEFQHHWSDVIAGAVLGLSVAAFTARYIVRMWEDIVPEEDELSLYQREEYSEIIDRNEIAARRVSGLY